MALQNFVDKVGPAISAAWLNLVDGLLTNVFQGATNAPQARANLTADLPLEVVNGGTGQRTPLLSPTNIGAILYPVTNVESAAGVTPTNQLYPVGDVRRYGATGAGGVVGADIGPFTTSKLVTGSEPSFVPSVGYKWDLLGYVDGNFESDGKLVYSNTGYVKYKTPQDNSVTDWNVGLNGIQMNAPQILILGDSITEGTGAPTIQAGYSWGVARSLMNFADHGFDADPGFGYHSTINLNDLVTLTEISTTGTFTPSGLVNSRLSLAAGQYIQFSQKSVASIDLVYDGSVSSGSLVFALNGTTYATKAVSGATLNSTYQTLTSLQSNSVAGLTNESDVIRITASGGTVVVTAAIALRTALGGPYVFVAPQSGTTYGDFTSAADCAEIAFYLNMLRPANEKLLILALGTNSIYNAAKATTPAAMITALNSIVTQVTALCISLRIAIHVPPRANETLWPVITAGYTHQDYANAIEDYCRTNNYTIIRHDRSFLSYGNNYSDGLHPNALGHRLMSQNVLNVMGVPYNNFLKTAVGDGQFNNQVDIPYNSTWGNFAALAANRVVATRVGNQVTLSGLAQPNASVSTTVGTVPAGFRPASGGLATRYLVCRSDAGAVGVTVDTTGAIILSAVPATFVSFDGVTFTISRP